MNHNEGGAAWLPFVCCGFGFLGGESIPLVMPYPILCLRDGSTNHNHNEL